ncbi:MAG: tetratricopeptide repeat protein [Verrucomicrobiaceae bacterium]|nr:tetratricopeptide repeat protein [Verrucomicrobiaceae bacterium]
MKSLPIELLVLSSLLIAACDQSGKSSGSGENVPLPPGGLAEASRCGDPHRILISSARKLPPPPLRDGIGSSSLKITTKSGEAQAYFDNGLNLLHAFWEFEAYRSFLRATQLDPDCAMAYWGIVMCMPGSNPEFLIERTHALERAVALKPGLSAKEQAYIAALQVLVSDGTQVFARRMEAIWKSDPTDADAGGMAAYHLKDGYSMDGKRGSGQEEAVRLIEEVLEKHPNHAGALHYGIHVYELGPEVERALPLCERLLRVAPRAAHLVHMPGHIYFYTGEYERAIQQFRAADAVDRAYLEKEGIEAAENENFTHNMHYLALAYAEAGRLREALLHAEELKRVKIASARLRSESSSVVAYEGRSIAGRLLIRAGQYSRAAEVLSREALDLAPSPVRYFIDGLTSVARGMDAAAQQKRDEVTIALGELARFTSLLNDSASRITASEEQLYAMRATRMLDLFARVLRAHAASSTATGRIFIQGVPEAESGGARMDPPLLPLSSYELVGDYFLTRGDAAAAKEAFQKALKERPRSGYVLLGLARAEKLAGNLDATAAAYREVMKAWPQGDSNLPGMSEAQQNAAP